MSSTTEARTGLLLGFAAYGMWGLLPLYWHSLEDTGAGEVLAHRMVWSLPTALLILLVIRRWSWIPPLLRNPRRLGLVALAAATISVNWGLFIWSVSADRVVEVSLGYFINPLVSIAFGVLLLRERLRATQWVAVGVGGSAVAVLGVAYGRVPWLSLGIALSFAVYGLLKKRVALGGVEGFSAETAVQFLPALAYLLFLNPGESSLTAGGPGHAVLLACSGLATALPLIAFGGAAIRLPLSTIGLLQYLAPASMFVLGLTVFHEPMPPERWAGFLLVWVALVLLSWDAVRTARRRTRPVLRGGPSASVAPDAPAGTTAQATAEAPAGDPPAAGTGPATR